MAQCPLCQTESSVGLLHTAWRKAVKDQSCSHWHCSNCDLIWLRSELLPDAKQEIERYQLHQNLELNDGYREHLRPVVNFFAKNIAIDHRQSAAILDFGSGPNPVLSKWLKELGYNVSQYDPFFAQREFGSSDKYSWIVMTEVVEHFHHPQAEFLRLKGLLTPAGELVIMTQLHQGPEHFIDWWYARDITHVCFYSARTFAIIRQQFSLAINLL